MNSSNYISSYNETFETTPDYNNQRSLDFSREILFKPLFIIASGIGFILCSLLLLLIVLRYQGKWKKQIILLVNILICDLLISCSGISFALSSLLQIQFKHHLLQNNLPIVTDILKQSKLYCANRISQRIWEVATDANLYGLLLITVDHFIAVRWSLTHATLMRNRTTVICCCAAWLVAIVLGFLPDMLISQQYHPHMENWITRGATRYCYQLAVYHHPEADFYTFSLNQEIHNDILNWIGAAKIAVVFLVMISVYCYIAHVVVSVNRRKKSQNSNYQSTYRNLKGVGTSIVLVFLFSLLYLPHAVNSIYQGLGGELKLSGTWRNTFVLLLCCTGIIDAIIYASRNSQIRQLFKKQNNLRYHMQVSKTTSTSLLGSKLSSSRSSNTANTNLMVQKQCDEINQSTRESKLLST